MRTQAKHTITRLPCLRHATSHLRPSLLSGKPSPMEGIMRTRLVALTLGLYFCFAVVACSKPTDSSNTTSSGPTSGAAPSTSDMKEKTEPVQALVIPKGTVITVRLAQAVGSKISEPGQSFSGTVATPVEVEGKVAVPSGAAATGTVVDAKPLGRF